MKQKNLFWQRFKRDRLGFFALWFLIVLFFFGLYAPFFASSRPFFVLFEGKLYFPFFRYLFYQGYYTKALDLFFNLWMFTLPFMLYFLMKHWKILFFITVIFQIAGFLYIYNFPVKDPAISTFPDNFEAYSWQEEKKHASDYKKLFFVMRYHLGKIRTEKLLKYTASPDTLWKREQDREEDEILRLSQSSEVDDHKKAKYLRDRKNWLERSEKKLAYMAMPFFRPYHWEDDAGGSEEMNKYVPWYELTRMNRKDLASALLFGIRISFVVGAASTLIALLIALPVGSFAGYYGGVLDLFVCRLLEVWEAVPTLFILMLVVSFFSTKSIFLIIALIGLFGWTGFCRFVRGEFLRQKPLSYVDACRVLGLSNSRIIFSHILPNSLTPVLTLIPFAALGAISSEAGLSFLGLGEEGSASLGALMDEGKTAFPGDSRLLWPPALLLTALLVAIALVGEAFRNALDPRETFN